MLLKNIDLYQFVFLIEDFFILSKSQDLKGTLIILSVKKLCIKNDKHVLNNILLIIFSL